MYLLVTCVSTQHSSRLHLRLYATLISKRVSTTLYKFGLLVRPQFPGLNYVANIAVEYSFIVLTQLELHQVPSKNF